MTGPVREYALYAPDGSIVDHGPDEAGLLKIAYEGYETLDEARAAVKGPPLLGTSK